MMNIEEARQLAKEKIEELARELERGQSESLRAYLAAMSRMPRYSLNNLLLIAAQRPQARQVAGFTTWQRLGRFVKKGEHGIAILAPCVKRRRSDRVPAKPKRDLSVKHAEADTDDVVIGFRGAHVFDISQTEGAPVPEFACVNGDPSVFTDRLKAHIADQGIELSYSERIAPARGITAGRQIVLLPGLPAGEEFSTLAHEAAHAAMHRNDGREQPSKTVRETEAEAVAYIVCQAIGLETNSAAADYITLYRGDTKTLAASLERIQKTAAQIIEAIGPDV
jgi:hypothetical protein